MTYLANPQTEMSRGLNQERQTAAKQATQGHNGGCRLKGVRLEPCDLPKLVFVRVPLKSQLAS